MKIYVVRHGETESNVKRLFQGRINTGLNEHGIDQAIEVKNHFKDFGIDLIISSPMNRCRETAEIISDGKLPTTYDERLIGRDHGEFTGNDREGKAFLDYWNYNKNIQYKEAESLRDLYARSVKTFLDIKEEHKDKNKIVLVTHSGIIKSLYFYKNGLPDDGDFTKYKAKNCEILEFNI
ncbi:MAG: histidine phosphatase family protein [Bacilli bacterium]|nr:histidine phosphatase family protein [Bacilli bacterium]MDD4607732.1 histidine phosphatase family protein [Bacilli bacterium]